MRICNGTGHFLTLGCLLIKRKLLTDALTSLYTRLLLGPKGQQSVVLHSRNLGARERWVMHMWGRVQEGCLKVSLKTIRHVIHME